MGLVAGIVELIVGSSIRPVDRQQERPHPSRDRDHRARGDRARRRPWRSPRPTDPSDRPAGSGSSPGCSHPALVCFTTVGRLWYVPGVLLVAAGCLAAYGLRGGLPGHRTDINRNGTRILRSGSPSSTSALASPRSVRRDDRSRGCTRRPEPALVRPRVSTPVAIAMLLVATPPSPSPPGGASSPHPRRPPRDHRLPRAARPRPRQDSNLRHTVG